MELTNAIKALDAGTVKRFCPYKGDLDWQVECIGARCMKCDKVTGECTRT